MYKVDEYVVYKKDVCKIIEIKCNHLQGKDYYILNPIMDQSLKIEIPIDCESIRRLISESEVKNIINKIPNIESININNRMMDNEYKNLMNSGSHEDLIRIIKTAYLRNKERTDSKKKIGDKDNNYFKLAEKYLYNEFAIVLNLSYDDTKNYVIKEVEKLI